MANSMYEIEIAYSGAASPLLERAIIEIVGREPDGTLEEEHGEGCLPSHELMWYDLPKSHAKRCERKLNALAKRYDTLEVYVEPEPVNPSGVPAPEEARG